MDTIFGKFLVRRSKTVAGEEVLVICGAAIPKNFPVTNVADNDEIWCAELMVMDIKKFVPSDPGSTGFRGSPETFLANPPNLKPEFSEWTQKK